MTPLRPRSAGAHAEPMARYVRRTRRRELAIVLVDGVLFVLVVLAIIVLVPILAP